VVVTAEPARSSAPAVPFTLLMAVYAGDRPDHLRRAFDSSVSEQHRRPDEVVIVQDGPVPAPLAACLDELLAAAPVPCRCFGCRATWGSANALEAGLGACSHEVVARMDADDISLPERFALLLPDIEAGAEPGRLRAAGDRRGRARRRRPSRPPPTSADVIARTARLHDPFNHPRWSTAAQPCRPRVATTAAADGGLLAVRPHDRRWGAIGEPTRALVKYRVGAGAYERRGGPALLRAELVLQWRFRRSGFTTRPQFVRNVVVRGLYRLVPGQVRKPFYRSLVATRGERLDEVARRSV
jgi:hypothetical protein